METTGLNFALRKRSKNEKMLSNPQREEKRWRQSPANLLLSPLHYDRGAQFSEVTSTVSYSWQNQARHRNEEQHKSGSIQKSYTTSSGVVGGSKRVLPSDPSSEKGLSLKDAFIALKNKYKIPFRFLNGIVPLVRDETVCPKELKARIEQFARFLDLPVSDFVALNMKRETLLNVDRNMQTILHMFRPLLREAVHWVEKFGRCLSSSEPSALSHPSSEDRSSNTSADMLRKSSAHEHPTSDNKEIKSNMSKKSRPEQGAYSIKGEDDVLRIHNEVNEDILPWNEKLQTAATRTVENLKGFMTILSQSKAKEEQELQRQVEVLRNFKSVSHNTVTETHEELLDNFRRECLSVERQFPHLCHEFVCDVVVYIICKTKCTAFQLPFLFLFPNLEEGGKVFFVLQNEPCGGGEIGQVLKTQFYQQLSADSMSTRTVSTILKTWGNITHSLICSFLKDLE
ncbi:hypothetical protein GAYE_SCF25G4489 [Galdieria yellowstonensis]|uniref:Uncharacterized protein n=1 Tax=Galdieria yellowstonensis TaxID=3028027 RepID=A0AAV9IH08_9RHOD|nr:hypothetical protein GAYE_SCF25G4489 [Galdieria yellowstonensis]